MLKQEGAAAQTFPTNQCSFQLDNSTLPTTSSPSYQLKNHPGPRLNRLDPRRSLSSEPESMVVFLLSRKQHLLVRHTRPTLTDTVRVVYRIRTAVRECSKKVMHIGNLQSFQILPEQSLLPFHLQICKGPDQSVTTLSVKLSGRMMKLFGIISQQWSHFVRGNAPQLSQPLCITFVTFSYRTEMDDDWGKEESRDGGEGQTYV